MKIFPYENYLNTSRDARNIKKDMRWVYDKK